MTTSRLAEVMETPLEQVRAILPPQGLYYGTLLYGSLGDEKIDKRSRAYRRTTLGVKLTSPDDNMDGDAADEFNELIAKGEESIVNWSKLVYGQNDAAAVRRLLERVGVELTGTLEETLKSVKTHGGIEVLVQVAHDTYEGETSAIAKALLSSDA